MNFESIALSVQEKKCNDLSYFFTYASYQVSSQLAFQFRRRREK